MDFSMVGPAIVLGLGCVGSCIGCGIAGMGLHGVMTHVEEGHGKFIGLSTLPASQSIYALILMVLMSKNIKAGTLAPMSAIGIGFFVGLALLADSVYQGKTISTALQAAAKQPAIFGKCAAAPVMIESFAIFAFVFALILI